MRLDLDTLARDAETWLQRVITLIAAGVPARLLMEVWAPLGWLFWPMAVVVFFTAARRRRLRWGRSAEVPPMHITGRLTQDGTPRGSQRGPV